MAIFEFLRGIRAYASAHHLIVKHRLWLFLIIPGVFSVLFVIALIITGGIYFDDIAQYMIHHWLPNDMQGAFTSFLTLFLLWILLTIAVFMTYKHVVLIVFAPILAHLSEKTEEIVYNDTPPVFSLALYAGDLARSLVINLRNIAITLFLTAVVWPFFFIPVIGAAIAGILILLIQAYYGGFGLADCVLERKRYSVRRSVNFARQNRSRLLGVGSGFMLIMAIPILGWFIAPAYGVVAATLAALEKIHEDTHKI